MHRTVALLQQRGHETRVFTSEDVPGHRRTALSYISSRKACKALLNALNESKPGAVHLHNFYHELSPGILSVLDPKRRPRGMRVVMTAHDAHLVCPNSGLCTFDRGVRRVISPDDARTVRSLLRHRWDHRGAAHSWLKLAQHVWNFRLRDRRGAIDCVICPSRFMQRCMEFAGRPTALLPHPVSVTPLAAESRSASRSTRSSALQLVFAGRVDPEKGIANFLQALSPEFPGRLIIIGDGSDLSRCREIVTQRGMHKQVQFAGRFPHHETIRIFAQSQVLILPSLVPENCPLSLLEALAVGTNILATDLGGSAEIIEQARTGFLFKSGDAPSLRNALNEIAAAQESGTLNAFEASPFLALRSEDAYVDQLLRLYDAGAAS